jgi:DNA cross-link repair 1A protein
MIYIKRPPKSLSLKAKRRRLRKQAAEQAEQQFQQHISSPSSFSSSSSTSSSSSFSTTTTKTHTNVTQLPSPQPLPQPSSNSSSGADSDFDGESEDSDASFPPTQIDEEQEQEFPPPPKFSNKRCPTCNSSLPYELMDAQVHIEECRRFLELTSKKSKKRSSAKSQKNTASSIVPLYVPTSVSHNVKHELWRCPICNVDGQKQSTEQRLRHVKRCGQKYGIRPHELSSNAVVEDDDENENDDATAAAAADDVETSIILIEENNSDSKNQHNRLTTISDRPLKRSKRSNQQQSMYNFVPKNAFVSLMNTAKRQHQMVKENTKYVAHQKKVKQQRKAWNETKKKRKTSWKRRVETTSKNINAVPLCKRIPTKPRPLIVDGFQYANQELSRFYFLSHFHSDHYIGLTKSFNCGLIFCSVNTKKLVHLRLNVSDQYVVGLPLNVPISLSKYDTLLDLESVTLLHANHTPDGVTFVFKLKNGQIHWHTGDFRYQPSMIQSNIDLLNSSKQLVRSSMNNTIAKYHHKLSVHTLYLDTTYCNPKYDLPTQDIAVKSVIQYMEKIKRHQSLSASADRFTSTIYLFGTYTIGKEKVFSGVSKHFNEKVIVLDTQKRKILKCIMNDYDDIIVNDSLMNSSSSSLFVVSMSDLNYDKIINSVMRVNKLRQASAGGRVTKVYGFKPTGWSHQSSSSSTSSSLSKKQQQTLPWASSASSASSSSSTPSSLPLPKLMERRRKVVDIDVTIVSVPYSEHSSFPELKDCVQTLGAKRILPTVGPFSQRDAMVEMLRKI